MKNQRQTLERMCHFIDESDSVQTVTFDERHEIQHRRGMSVVRSATIFVVVWGGIAYLSIGSVPLPSRQQSIRWRFSPYAPCLTFPLGANVAEPAPSSQGPMRISS